jgi:mono/diheme cytochrome c family protein
MKRALRWTLYGLIGVIVVAAVVAGALNQIAERKRMRVVKVEVKAVAVPSDADALAHGKYLFESRGCAECHGHDGKGKVVIDAPNGLFARSPNITQAGTSVAKYTVQDWVRVVRHGVKPDGRPVLIMPSQDYSRLSDPDVGALIAYVKSLPPVGGGEAELRLPFLVRALYGAGVIPDAADVIDHTLPPAPEVPVGPTVEHGKYVANMCVGCHGPGLSGGKIPGAPPDWPAASNLTPGEGSALARYSNAANLRAMFRTGRRPDGSPVSTVMPFESLRALNDIDVDALYAYLKTVSPRSAGSR